MSLLVFLNQRRRWKLARVCGGARRRCLLVEREKDSWEKRRSLQKEGFQAAAERSLPSKHTRLNEANCDNRGAPLAPQRLNLRKYLCGKQSEETFTYLKLAIGYLRFR